MGAELNKVLVLLLFSQGKIQHLEMGSGAARVVCRKQPELSSQGALSPGTIFTSIFKEDAACNGGLLAFAYPEGINGGYLLCLASPEIL